MINKADEFIDSKEYNRRLQSGRYIIHKGRIRDLGERAENKDEKLKSNKFNAKRVVYKGEVFHSQKECDFFKQKELEMLAGEIIRIERQVRYSLDVEDEHITDYILDFKIYYKDMQIKCYDVKGYKKGTAYENFKKKKRLMKALYNIEVIEI